jgi:tetraprenyl-beta-curcumene synthase
MGNNYFTYTKLNLLRRFIQNVFPLVDTELSAWHNYAQNHCCPLLREQALASIQAKRFHCLGGSVYSLYPKVSTADFVRLVVALQTISDYLDNLCDRAGVAEEAAFRQLHLAMTDALDPASPQHNYYAAYPVNDDGGYLDGLVQTCRRILVTLPRYKIVKPLVLTSAGLYSELQTYKHLHPADREAKMLNWINRHLPAYPEINPWEFAAATGSTLSIFVLCAAASDPTLDDNQAQAIAAAYFPWINGLHILLDYFIDLAEDRVHNDLNFVAYYPDDQTIATRLALFNERALALAGQIPYAAFTQTVIQGLLALYLSDAKTRPPREQQITRIVLNTAGNYTKLMYGLCKVLRTAKKI